MGGSGWHTATTQGFESHGFASPERVLRSRVSALQSVVPCGVCVLTVLCRLSVTVYYNGMGVVCSMGRCALCAVVFLFWCLVRCKDHK